MNKPSMTARDYLSEALSESSTSIPIKYGEQRMEIQTRYGYVQVALQLEPCCDTNRCNPEFLYMHPDGSGSQRAVSPCPDCDGFGRWMYSPDYDIREYGDLDMLADDILYKLERYADAYNTYVDQKKAEAARNAALLESSEPLPPEPPDLSPDVEMEMGME